jgi:hypothetical protein
MKSFTNPALGAPIDFELSGTDITGVEWSEKFSALPTAPTKLLHDFFASFYVNDAGQKIYNAESIVLYLRGVLLDDEQVARFDTLTDDRVRLVQASMLGDLVEWLAPQQSGFPSTPPAG